MKNGSHLHGSFGAAEGYRKSKGLQVYGKDMVRAHRLP